MPRKPHTFFLWPSAKDTLAEGIGRILNLISAAVSNATPGTFSTGNAATWDCITTTTGTPMTTQTLSKKASVGTFAAEWFDRTWTTKSARDSYLLRDPISGTVH